MSAPARLQMRAPKNRWSGFGPKLDLAGFRKIQFCPKDCHPLCAKDTLNNNCYDFGDCLGLIV
jgi:hypothetical protein